MLLNLISLAATLGVMVLFWQDGHGSNAIFGIAATGAVTFWIPLMVFAFLFGLSMDYEVFILSRIREEYDAGRSTNAAVIEGIGRTGRLVTSAALILFLAFAALASGPGTDLKTLATGLGFGILLDATIVRSVLVPGAGVAVRHVELVPARARPACCGWSRPIHTGPPGPTRPPPPARGERPRGVAAGRGGGGGGPARGGPGCLGGVSVACVAGDDRDVGAHRKGLAHLLGAVGNQAVEHVVRDDERQPAVLEVVDRGEALGKPAGIDEDYGADRPADQVVPHEPEPVLPGRAEQVEDQVVVERDAAEVHRDGRCLLGR